MTNGPHIKTVSQEELEAHLAETTRQVRACIEMYLQHPVPERAGLLRTWTHRHMEAYAVVSPNIRTDCVDFCPCRQDGSCCNCGSRAPHKAAAARCVNCGAEHTWAQCGFRADDFRPAPGPMHVKPCPWHWPSESPGTPGHQIPTAVCNCQGEDQALKEPTGMARLAAAHMEAHPGYTMEEDPEETKELDQKERMVITKATASNIHQRSSLGYISVPTTRGEIVYLSPGAIKALMGKVQGYGMGGGIDK